MLPAQAAGKKDLQEMGRIAAGGWGRGACLVLIQLVSQKEQGAPCVRGKIRK